MHLRCQIPRGMKPYERLLAWKACHELTLAVYRATESWPKREMFGLAAQSRRAAYSAAANIAEGRGKKGVRELRRFLDISVGSLNELSYALRLARDLKMGSAQESENLEKLREDASRLTWLFYAAILRKVNATRNPSQ